MARLFTAGAETNDATNLEGFVTTIPTIVTDVVRSGSRAFSTDGRWDISGGGTLGRTYNVRAYFRWSVLPTSDSVILAVRDFTLSALIRWFWTNSTGTLDLEVGPGLAVQASFTPVTGVWYRIEAYVSIGSGAVDTWGGAINGGILASGSGASISDNVPTNLVFQPGTGATARYDDIAVNDSTGAAQNALPGEGKVVLLLPISDNARAALWTGGAGGTTNLWDAVNNTPPVGLASASATNTSQIEHAGGAAGTTDAYDANMTTPATAGIGASDTINCALFMEVDGEDIATGTKLLNFEVLSNPVIASPGNVTAGNDGGAEGTYPTLWVVRRSAPVYGSALTVGTSPVMRARRPETVSRVASVCFMGIYIDYTPRRGPPFDGARRLVRNSLLRR
jgi:hypothetical protein